MASMKPLHIHGYARLVLRPSSLQGHSKRQRTLPVGPKQFVWIPGVKSNLLTPRLLTTTRSKAEVELDAKLQEAGRVPLIAMASNLLARVSNLRAMASNLIAMAPNLLGMASNLVAMASNLIAMASNLLPT